MLTKTYKRIILKDETSKAEKEKSKLTREFLSVIGLFVLTIFIQFTDDRINAFNDSVNQDIFEAFNTLLIETAEKISAEFAVFKQFIPWNKIRQEQMERIKKDIIGRFNKTQVKDERYIEIHSQLERGEISLQEFYSKIALIHSDKSDNYLNVYNAKMAKINVLLKKGTVWSTIKTFSFIALSLLISYLIYDYLRLIKKVK